MTRSPSPPPVDSQASVAIEIVRNALAAIADEMAITHVRTAYSSVTRDMLDFSTAVCDGRGRAMAQGLSLALQLGAIPRFMAVVRDRVVPCRGDVYVVNHPWQGGVHLPDFFFAKPVYVDDREDPVAWTVMVSHMVDVGATCTSGWERAAIARRSTDGTSSGSSRWTAPSWWRRTSRRRSSPRPSPRTWTAPAASCCGRPGGARLLPSSR